MRSVRCEICRLRLPTSKKLIYHYVSGHSKLQVIKSLMKCSILLSTPKNKAKNVNKSKKTKIFSIQYPKNETLYLNDNIHILCSRNEIIIGDEKNNVGMEFLFDDSSFSETQNRENTNTIIDSAVEQNNNNDVAYKANKTKPQKPKALSKKEIKKKSPKPKKLPSKKVIRKPRHYRINITKLEERNVLNEKSGDFYICRCRGDKTADLQIFTHVSNHQSDLNNASIAAFVEMKAFCSKCGNGYKSDEELMEHMKIHEMHCRVCNEIFPTEQQFKDHTRTHIFKVYACHICDYEYPFKQLLHKHFECHMDNEVTDTVLDMEEDYNISRHNFSLLSHHNSINSILRFLSEGHEICYYSYKYMKTICDICYHELFVCDYEQHLQNVHYQYLFP